MLGENHALIYEFPDFVDHIQHLKTTNTTFATMAERYHELDHKIRALELTKVPTDDEHFVALKLERLHLKDKLYQYLV
ncbi:MULTISPECIES: YdcH family protein [Shewanella]|uniref:YdcH family protein n=1 Tax=Shewanella mangrovisoli TaxID=2864211 RepID=A0ABV4VGA6_9GAMM|nr:MULTISPECIES: YdcH family protein [Shewanella]QYJ72717.1 YdcH family protein [Shewanella sp. FJAT-51649]QYK10357.1 YdcH family protein [Shewanella mangrovisoli]